MKLKQTFFGLFLKKLRNSLPPLQLDGSNMDYLNANEIVYIHRTAHPDGSATMHISFATHHEVAIRFSNITEYQTALEKITK